MFRIIAISAARRLCSGAAANTTKASVCCRPLQLSAVQCQLAAKIATNNLTPAPNLLSVVQKLNPSMLDPKFLTPLPGTGQVRTLTKFSLQTGKRKTVKAVLKRFYRLDWGIWIHTKCGRNKHLWKKSSSRKRRLRQHVFCNATQSYMLDKMVTKGWKRQHHYVDDPYTPYHTREEFPLTRRKPAGLSN